MSLRFRAAACLLFLAAFGARAQFPNHPVTLIVPFAAGGPTDVVARTLGASMSKTLGQISREDLLAEAAKEKSPGGWLCEARYHLAQRHLAAGELEPARTLLEAVVAECPADFDERIAAQPELQRLR